MQTKQKVSEDPEAAAIILKLGKDGKSAPRSGGGDYGDEEEEGGDVGNEAQLAAAEEVFRIFKGRAPNEQEAEETRTALQAWDKACGR